jgi:adhesin transport system membrane fusion protein
MRDEDTQFMSDLEAARHMRPRRGGLVLFAVIAALFVFLIGWAYFSTVEKVVRAKGKVVPSQKTQVVQSLEGGVIKDILVEEGDEVEKNQVLIKISKVRFASKEGSLRARYRALRAKRARLKAEIEGTKLKLPQDIVQNYPKIARNQRELYRSRQDELDNALAMLENKIQRINAELDEINSKIASTRENIRLLKKELKITRRMVDQQAMPELEEIKLERELNDLRGNIQANKDKKRALQAELQSAKKERKDQTTKLRSQALGELNKVKAEIAELQEKLKSASEQVRRTSLRAPVDGVVNTLNIDTVGGVVEPAEKLAEIVPSGDDLKITARVRPDDIAFLKTGQPANVKITAYNPQQYGALEGELTRISANSVTDRKGNTYFEIDVETKKDYMGNKQNPLPITPGMVARVEVITGERTILDYLIQPLQRTRDVAFTER